MNRANRVNCTFNRSGLCLRGSIAGLITLTIAALAGLGSPIASVQAQVDPQEIPTEITIPLQLEVPSLYWHIEEYGEGLIAGWIIDPDERVVKITVDPAVWFAADYIQRYELLQELGLITGDDDYGILLQDDDQTFLATYIQKDGKWEITPTYLGATPFRPTRRFFSPFTP
ncbi:hypothetical protein [Thalassoporum mexicanum]|uniref:hypothetical protein n=1 Tax=Thalassoporum mexicanum TaxID=3457544 RepID=UPI00031A7F4E|nr:hypothetical protein [Pseudanabaena sp. PCC 7367]